MNRNEQCQTQSAHGWLVQEAEKAKHELECELNKIPPEQRKSRAIEILTELAQNGQGVLNALQSKAYCEKAQWALLLLGVPLDDIVAAITHYMLTGEMDSSLHTKIVRIAKGAMQS